MTNETKLYRQVHPAWTRLGRVTSQAFRPTAKDIQRLSVYDGDQISPKGAFEHYSQSRESLGVLAVTVGECKQLGLRVAPDPLPYPEHVIIDFSQFSNSETRRLAKKLVELAEDRGWQYRLPKSGV